MASRSGSPKMRWSILPTGPLNARADLSGIDAALVWADASKWCDFRRPSEGLPTRVPAILEIALGSRAEFDALCSSTIIPRAYSSERRFVTAEFTMDDLRRIVRRIGVGAPVVRLELQAPYIPSRPRPIAVHAPPRRWAAAPRSQSKVLLGVIDHGCPFAHATLRQGRGTRVLGLWMQDPYPSVQIATAGVIPRDFGYGVQLDRTALNRAIAAHSDSTGTVDEAGCYESLGMIDLRYRYSHGGAALTTLAGTRPPIVRLPREADPPSLECIGDIAANSDIVFVQGPRDAQQDSSSGGLGRNLLDALTYILSCAGDRTESVIINCSDGTSRGSHDGRWLITEALQEALTRAAASRRVRLIVPAGNTGNDARHAELVPERPGEWTGVDLFINPDTETATQVIVRVPAELDDLEIRVAPPGRRGNSAHDGAVASGEARGLYERERAICAVIFPKRGPAASVEALVTWAPTAGTDARSQCPAGLWRLELRSRSGSRAPVHLYIPRTQGNSPQLERGRQARFVDMSSDGAYDPTRWLRENEADPQPPRSPIRRSGSLSGLATAPTNAQMEVVGGVFLRERDIVPYSSMGPNVSVPANGLPSRSGPDSFRPTDISRGQQGIPVCGVLSGQVLNAKGTSFAAPQHARARANEDRMHPSRTTIARQSRIS